MITKILFTIAIAGAVAVFFKHAGGGAGVRRAQTAPTAGGRVPPAKGTNIARLAAYGVIALMVAGSALWLIFEWRDAHEVLGVRVINSSTGATVDYEAYRSDIGTRSFRTLDGRRVNLAEVERLEVME